MSVIKKAGLAVATVVVFAVLLLSYNALIHLVFWGHTEDVRVASGDISIACTFARPNDGGEGDGKFPAVIVLLGSGPETRGGPAYRMNASTMLRHGFAILICDKRGAGDSSGDFDTATFAEFIEDAKASIRYLANREDIDANNIGLLANSESGWFSAQLAVETGQIAFIINRVGPPLPWMDVVLWEVRNEFIDAGITETDLEPLLSVTERRWNFYAAVGNNPDLQDDPERDYLNGELDRLRQSIPFASDVLPEKVADYDPDVYRYYAVNATYDPRPFLRQLDIPLLFVYGGVDVNIPTDDCVAYLENFKNEYKGSIDIRVYPELGHPMATWRGFLHGGYPPDYLGYAGNWARSQVTN